MYFWLTHHGASQHRHVTSMVQEKKTKNLEIKLVKSQLTVVCIFWALGTGVVVGGCHPDAIAMWDPACPLHPGCLVASLALAPTWDSQREGCLQMAAKSTVGASGVREASGGH